MIKNVKIIGLGLMGANLGINLINKGINVYGQDINHDVEKRAEKYGINVGSNIQNYDITILSMPINNIITFLSREHQDDKSDLIIDIGGTKESICNLMDNSKIPAIGGHPMCGLADNTNWEPHPEMYKDATFLLCETNSTNDKAREIAAEFISILDCKEVWIDRKKHDEILSITSHLPHLISSALVISGFATLVQINRVGPIGSGLLSLQGTSFAFVGPLIFCYQTLISDQTSEEALGVIFGSTAFCSLIIFLLSFFLKHL